MAVLQSPEVSAPDLSQYITVVIQQDAVETAPPSSPSTISKIEIDSVQEAEARHQAQKEFDELTFFQGPVSEKGIQDARMRRSEELAAVEARREVVALAKTPGPGYKDVSFPIIKAENEGIFIGSGELRREDPDTILANPDKDPGYPAIVLEAKQASILQKKHDQEALKYRAIVDQELSGRDVILLGRRLFHIPTSSVTREAYAKAQKPVNTEDLITHLDSTKLPLAYKEGLLQIHRDQTSPRRNQSPALLIAQLRENRPQVVTEVSPEYESRVPQRPFARALESLRPLTAAPVLGILAAPMIRRLWE
jgi:hypothetical protein